MGLLRLFFALSVVVTHAYPLFGYKLLDPAVAVHSFFIISGFYMALILNEKYIGKNNSYKLFISNRLLRIYPLYWIILLLLFFLSLSKYFLSPSPDDAIKMFLNFAHSSGHYWTTIVMSILRNLTLIISTDYFQQNFHDPGYLLLLPAWTLQIEVLFYLLAPFLVKCKTRTIFILMLPFILITFTNIFPLFHSDTSIMYIFLSKFVFFLFGIMSYKGYRYVKTNKTLNIYSGKIFILFSLFLIVFGIFSTSGDTSKNVIFYPVYYLIFTSVIPFTFYFSQTLSFDTVVGNLSYPVYLSHLLIFKLISNSPIPQNNHSLITLITIVSTLLFSYVLVKFVEGPIDVLRNKRLATNTKKSPKTKTYTIS